MGDLPRIEAGQKRGPFASTADAERDVVDTIQGRAIDTLARSLGEMNDGTTVKVQPVTFEAKRRARALLQASDFNKELANGREIVADNGGVVQLHGGVPVSVKLVSILVAAAPIENWAGA